MGEQDRRPVSIHCKNLGDSPGDITEVWRQERLKTTARDRTDTNAGTGPQDRHLPDDPCSTPIDFYLRIATFDLPSRPRPQRPKLGPDTPLRYVESESEVLE